MKKLVALFTTAMLVTAMAVPASAAAAYDPVAGTSTTFKKYLIMDAGDTVPNATFSFTIAPGAAISTDTSVNTEMQVLAGVGTPTVSSVTFGPSDTTSTTTTGKIDINRTQEARTGTVGTDTVQFDAGEKFAEKTATIDFSSVTFDEPGIYRYIVSETASAEHAAAGIIHDTDADRVLDVYVTDDGAGTLVVSGYVLHTNVSEVAIGDDMGSADVEAAGDALPDKTDGFTNEYTTKDLKMEKEVTGNQASRDKWFEFTATLTNVNDNDSFVVSITADEDATTNDGNADATTGTTSATRASNRGQTNATTVTGAQLKAGTKFYLQHGQSIVIRGLPLNASYTVTEDAEDYESAVKSGDTNSGVIATVAGSSKMATAGFTNTRDGIIPTGVAMGIGGALVLCGAAGLYFFLRRRNAAYED